MQNSFPLIQWLPRCGALVTALSSFVLMSGCSHPSPSSPSATLPPTSILVAVDRSESTRPLRTQFFSQMDTVTNYAISQDLPVDVWAYDRSALRVYGPRHPQTRDDLDQIKRTELAPNDLHLRTITRPALLLEAMVHDQTMHHSTGVFAVVLTDGDAEEADDEPRLVAAARALGTDPSFRMAVIDIKPADRKMWDNALAKAMPGRYVLAGQAEGDASLKQFLQGKIAQ